MIFLLLLLGTTNAFLTTIQEGNVGVFYRFGQLLPMTYAPGLYLHFPWPITMVSQINVRPQTDHIHKVSCGTLDGLNLLFEQVDIGNSLNIDSVIPTIQKYGENYDEYLVKDKVRHQLQIICSTMTAHEVFLTRFDVIDDLLQQFLLETNDMLKSGLTIDFVRLSKPTLPDGIRKNYERIAEEKTTFKVEIERQERLKKEAETKRMMEEKEQQLVQYRSQMNLTIEMERSKTVDTIRIAKMETDLLLEFQKANSEEEIRLVRKNSEEELVAIDNRISQLRVQQEAKGLTLLYEVPGYREIQMMTQLAKAIEKNSKFFFGDTIPNFFVPWIPDQNQTPL